MLRRALRPLILGAVTTWLAAIGACSEQAPKPELVPACAEGCGPCEICEAGKCVAAKQGADCLDGQCYAGQCCTGCWDGANCHSGDQLSICGNAGNRCEDCSASKTSCLERACDLPCRFATVAVGRGSTYALRSDHRLYAWGSGQLGQLGLGAVTNMDVASPTEVTTSQRWRRLAAGATHACALVSGDELYCWGNNGKGQLGLGDAVARLVPTRINSEILFAQIAAEGQSSCAIDRQAALQCWGDNAAGQLGMGADAPASLAVPTPVGTESDWLHIAVGSGYACGIRAPGSLYCWGTNTASRLGVGSSDATLVQSLPKRVGSDSDWTSIVLGTKHACAIKSDASLHCWGDNSHGQLGTGDRAHQSAPARIGSSHWHEVALGDSHSCGIDTLGSLFCWGVANSGTAASDQLSPLAVAQDQPYVTVSARANITCAVTGDGTLKCWGDNSTFATGNSTSAIVSGPKSTCIAVASAPMSDGAVDAGVGNGPDAGGTPVVTCPATPDCSSSVCAGKSCGEQGQVCAGGVCSCPSGQSREANCSDGKDDDCDGQVDCTDSDCATAQCGAESYHRCCGGTCVDTSTNVAHCQGCGLACASGQSCSRITDGSGARGHCTCVGNANCPHNPGQICRAGNGDGQDGLCACDVVSQGNSGCASGQTCSNVAKANFCHY
jgi:alpha-tubulin suppressor-like RCC1 family protein